MITLKQQTTVTNAAGATIAVSFTSPVTQGSMVLVAFASGGPNSPASTVTDNQSNAYTRIDAVRTTGGGAHIELFYAKNVLSNGSTFTVSQNYGGASVSSDTFLVEYAGVDPVNALDTANGTTGTSVTPTASIISPFTGNCLIVAVTTDDAADSTSISAGTGFSIKATQLIISTRNRFGFEDKIQNSLLVTPSLTIGTSASWAIIAASFRPADSTIGNRYRYGSVSNGMSRSEGWT